MLGKLIKYDLRSMVRRFAPLWAGLAALAVVNGFSIRYVLNQWDRFSGGMVFFLGILPIILLAVLGIAVGVMTLVYVCERFYKGLLGDEGYLMLTLPVSSETHIAAKTVTAMLLEICNGLVAVACGLLLLAALGNDYLRNLWHILGDERLWQDLAKVPAWVWPELPVYMIACIVAQTMHIYAAVCIGHLAKTHRAAWSFLAYVGISVALSSAAVSLTPLLDYVPQSLYLNQEFTAGGAVTFSINGRIFPLGLLVMILWQLLQCGAFFAVSDGILKHRLNLE